MSMLQTWPCEDEEATLDEILENVWHLLTRGLQERRHGFHLPVLATFDPQSGPQARAVVLRGLDRRQRLLRLHTDLRSAKVAEIAREPRVGLQFHDPAEQTQVRVQAVARLHRTDAAAEAAWRGTRLFSRRCYLARHAPGTPSELPSSGLPHWALHRTPGAAESEAGRANFAVLLCEIRSFDWLYLSHLGHRRARFAWDAAGRLEATWLQP